MATKTKAQRIAEHQAKGLSALDAEIAIAQEDAQASIAKAKARAAKHRSRVLAVLVEQIEADDKAAFDKLYARAEKAIEQEAHVRSANARRGTRGTDVTDLGEDEGGLEAYDA